MAAGDRANRPVMKTITVDLGGKAYVINALPMRQARIWREALGGPFAELTQTLEGAGKIELSNATDIAAVVRSLSGTLIGSIDTLMDLLFAYSPELAADRERIEDEAYDDEALAALVEVLKLAYPFGGLLAAVNGRPASKT